MPIVRLKLGHETPFFLVHGIGGDADSFLELASVLPESMPLFCFKVEERGGRALACDSISQIAAGYIQEMRAIQPHGPYRLGGYSFGGSVAHEMTCQLAALGVKVSPLVIIDHVPAPLRYKNYVWDVPKAIQVTANLGRWFHTTLVSRTGDMTVKTALARASGQAWKMLAKRFTAPGEFDTAYFSSLLAEPMREVMKVHSRALRAYQPPRYSGRLVLIRGSTMQLFRPYPYCLGWRRYVDDLTVRVIFGNHTTILKAPLVQELARQIRLAVIRCDRGATESSS